jgi:hypothetical protein
VPVTLKQFFTPLFLRISAIQNLDPGAALTLCDIGAEFVLGHNSLQVHSRAQIILPHTGQ